MAFRGCFIGIDRYAARSISELASAVRHAEALHALFADNFGGDGRLIVNEQATAAALRTALAGLHTCDAADIVVIAFSGHGTSTRGSTTSRDSRHRRQPPARGIAQERALGSSDPDTDYEVRASRSEHRSVQRPFFATARSRSVSARRNAAGVE